MTFSSNLNKHRYVLLLHWPQSSPVAPSPSWDPGHVHAVWSKVSHFQFFCCHNKQIPSMCAALRCVDGGPELEARTGIGNWYCVREWDRDWDRDRSCCRRLLAWSVRACSKNLIILLILMKILQACFVAYTLNRG